MKRPLRIGVLGPYHSRNFGDTAIQTAVISRLRRTFPGAELIGICHDPGDTESTHGIAACSISGRAPAVAAARSLAERGAAKVRSLIPERARCLMRIAARCRTLDLLLISGSGQLDDFWGGAWQHPFKLLVWSFLARLGGGKVIVFGIGWDDLSTPLGKRFAFGALKLAHYRVFRDAGTVEKLAAAGVRLVNHVCPDPAFGLESPVAGGKGGEAPVIMVCPIAARAWLESADPSYERYLEALTECCRGWLGKGYRVRLASSQKAMDTPLALRIAGELRESGVNTALLEAYEASSVSHYLKLAAGADLVVASRLHALILAVVAQTPVVAISYGRKVTRLMGDMGLAEYCMELPDFSVQELKGAVERALDRREGLASGLSALLTRYRTELDEQYQVIERLAGAEHSPHLSGVGGANHIN